MRQSRGTHPRRPTQIPFGCSSRTEVATMSLAPTAHSGEMTQLTNSRWFCLLADLSSVGDLLAVAGTSPLTAEPPYETGYRMGVEATALSRSKLEQKDRAELAAIVEAMGGRAGSRAKK